MFKYNVTLAAITIVMIGAFVFAFMNGGSPSYVQGARIDGYTVQKVRDYKYAIDNYANVNYRLPASLAELEQSSSYNSYRSYDKTNEKPAAITYAQTSDTSYTLCSTFTTEEEGVYNGAEYAHPAGAHCFRFTTTVPSPYPTSPYYNTPLTPTPSTSVPLNVQASPAPGKFTLTWSGEPATLCEYTTLTSAGKKNDYQTKCTVATNGQLDTTTSYCQTDTGASGYLPTGDNWQGPFTTSIQTPTKPKTIKAYVHSASGTLLTCNSVNG